MDRTSLIRSLFDADGPGLEIGPSHSPLFPKAEGFDVEVLDYLDAEGLRVKYGAVGCDVSRVEPVDHVADGRPLPDVVGDVERYRWIVASHVIEHVPDLLGFLDGCERLLRPGGCLVLAVPDKRFCFDLLRPASTVGGVIDAHLQGRRRPSPGSVFDDVAYARRRGGAIAWFEDDARPLSAVRPLSAALDLLDEASARGRYHDVHCWTFVPSSFRHIMSVLHLSGKTGFSLSTFRRAGGEFLAVLRLGADPDPCDPDTLLLEAQREERAVPLDPEHAT